MTVMLIVWLPMLVAAAPVHEHTVTCGKRFATLEVEGIVACEESDYHGIHCPREEIPIAWRALHGAVLRKGDPIYAYTTETRCHELPIKELELLCAEREIAGQFLTLERELADLLTEHRALEDELAVSTAALGSLVHVDEMEVELLRRELERERQNIETRRNRRDSQRALYNAGNASQRDVDAAEIALRRAELKGIGAEVEWRDAARKVDLLGIQLKELEIEDLRARLGTRDGNNGMVAKVKALEAKLDGQREQLRTTHEKAEFELHRERMVCYDHVPLGYVELRGPDRKSRRISFQPATAPVPAGWQADTGVVYSAERGYGWQVGREDWMNVREGTNTSATVAIVRNQATWRCAVATGGCDVVIGIGDDREWHGLLVRANDEVVFVDNKLEKNDYRKVELTLPADASELVLQFGGPHALTGRAEIDGVLKTQPWSPNAGGKAHGWSVSWPALYLMQPEKYFVEARVPREWTGFFLPPAATNDVAAKPAEMASMTPDTLQNLVAARTVAVVTPTGLALTGTVHEVGTEPVQLSFAPQTYRDEAARVRSTGQARGVKIRLAPQEAARLQIGARVRVQALIDVPDEVPSVPSQFVQHRDGRDFASTVAGANETRLEGLRVADVFMVTAGLQGGDRVRVPVAGESDGTDNTAFEGEVIPGEHTVLGGPGRIWGRIKSLIPDGSFVEEGDWIMTLYDPFLDEHKKSKVHDKKLAQQRYLQMAEERRLKSITADLEHQAKVMRERIDRIKVRAIADVQPVKEAQAANAYRSASIALDAAQGVAGAMRASEAYTPPSIRASERQASLRRVARDRQRLAYVRVLRGVDWVKQAEAAAEWNNARRELGIRDRVLNLARQEEESARITARLQLEADLKQNAYEKLFELLKVVYAPARGRLFYKSGYSWVKEGMDKFGEGSEVWGGRPFGLILDMNRLALVAELPENMYHRVHHGMKAAVRFDHLNRLEVPATIQEVGRAFHMQKKTHGDKLADESISNDKYFEVTVAFSPPKHFQDRLMPGTRGQLVIEQ